MLRASVSAVGIRVFKGQVGALLWALLLGLWLGDAVWAEAARYRGGVRNAPEKPSLSEKQLQQVLKSLREKTGWAQLAFDAEGFLVCPQPTECTHGSAAARQLLSAALASQRAFDLQAHDRSSQVVFARLAPGINYESRRTGEKIEVFPLQVDFGDFYQLRGDAAALKAFDLGLVILHELAHGVWQLPDARSEDEEPGECESYINRIRRELNMPERLQYQARLRPGSLNVAAGTKLIASLVKAFMELDCSLAEINPMIVTKQGEVKALDAKMSFDDNALFRHADVAACRDLNEEDPKEVEAKKFDLNYIALHGNIGCMVNGAGLAMATMDVIQQKGGMPANFLDVGGGATAEKVTAAFKIITSDPEVKAIFVNIFGGIMKCDTIATGVIAAVKEVGLQVPLVVRLEGTNVELGRKLLQESGLDLQTASSLDEAAEKIVKAAR